MPDIEYINPRSEEIQDIMERTPGWMMRWGITLFFAFLVLLVGTSWFIQYPDVITTSIIITSEHPPLNLVAESTGKLKCLFVKDKEKVDSNTVLALIDNPADYVQVQLLKSMISDTSFLNNPLPAYQLGEIQNTYSAFKQAKEDYSSFKSFGISEHKIKAIEQQEASQQVLYGRILQQFHTLTEEYQLAILKCQTDSQLCAKEVIPKMEYNNSRSTLLQKKYAWQGSNSTLAQTQVQVNELNKAVTELKLQALTDDAKYTSTLNKSVEQLRTAIKTWEQKYVVVAPMPGTVNLFNYWSANMPVKQGDVLMIITPEKSGSVIGRINLKAYGSARVKEGQKVNIKLDNYPFEEYGMLVAQISSVSLLPKDSLYVVRITFPDGMKSSYNKQLDFKQQMTGTAEIITEKKRLFERMLNKVKIRI
jgi:HlyD family secretion protein